MKNVWRELTKQNRYAAGYSLPAKRSERTEKSNPVEAQDDALRYVFFFAFNLARDRVSVSKAAEVQALTQPVVQQVEMLRGMADDLTAVSYSDPRVPAWAATLREVADWFDAHLGRLRKPDDPLTIQHDHGDPVARGVQILFANMLQEQFGTRLDRTAATLTAVALGLSETPSPRVSRSALSGRKST